MDEPTESQSGRTDDADAEDGDVAEGEGEAEAVEDMDTSAGGSTSAAARDDETANKESSTLYQDEFFDAINAAPDSTTATGKRKKRYLRGTEQQRQVTRDGYRELAQKTNGTFSLFALNDLAVCVDMLSYHKHIVRGEGTGGPFKNSARLHFAT